MPERPYEEEEDEDEIGPGHPDYDLSEAHGYTWEPAHREWPPRWLIVGLTIIIIVGLILPTIILIARS